MATKPASIGGWGYIGSFLASQVPPAAVSALQIIFLDNGTGVAPYGKYQYSDGAAWNDFGSGGGGGTWGTIGGTLSNQTDLQNALNLKANIASPAFSGVPTAPTNGTATDNSAQLATDGFVQNAIVAAARAPLASPAFTGVPTAPTNATATDASPQVATDAFVQAAIAIAKAGFSLTSVSLTPASRFLMPTGSGSAGYTAFGTTAPTLLDTSTANSRAIANTNPLTDQARVGYVSAAAAVNRTAGGICNGAASLITPNGTSQNDMIRGEYVFSISDALASGRLMVGAVTNGSMASLTSAEPSLRTDAVFIGADSTANVLYVKVGSNAVVNTTLTQGTNLTDKVKFQWRWDGFPTNTVSWAVFAASTTSSAYAPIASGTASANLPAAGLTWFDGFARNSAANAATCSLEFYQLSGGAFTNIGDTATIGALNAPVTAAAGRNVATTDVGRTILYTGAGAADFTVPAGLGFPCEVELVKEGTGNPRFVAGAGVSINLVGPGTAVAGPVTIQFSGIMLQAVAVDSYRVVS